MIRRLAGLAMLATAIASACTNGRAIDPPAAAGSFAPRLSQLGDRTVLSWVERDAAGVSSLRFALRNEKGWGPARTAVSDRKLVSDTLDVPGVVPVGGGGLAAHWTVKRGSSKDARDLMVALSKDGGTTWGVPVCPHRDATDTEHGMATLVPAAHGPGFGICWLDGRAGALSEYGDGATALYWADWSGEGFGPERELDPRVCDCCKTSAAEGADGPVIAYRDRDEKDRRDISMLIRDADAWSAPRPVHDDGWTIQACPTNGPAVATRGDRTAVAWFTATHATPSVWVEFAPSGGPETAAPVRLDAGLPVGRAEAAMLADGSAVVAWLERKGADAQLRARRLAPDGQLSPSVIVATTSPSRASGYPAIAVEDERDVLIAWTETGPKGRVRAKVVTLP